MAKQIIRLVDKFVIGLAGISCFLFSYGAFLVQGFSLQTCIGASAFVGYLGYKYGKIGKVTEQDNNIVMGAMITFVAFEVLPRMGIALVSVLFIIGLMWCLIWFDTRKD